MGYKIKICNKKGCQLSGVYGSKREATSVIKKNREADRKLNQGGLRSLSTGRLVRINNRYKLVKE